MGDADDGSPSDTMRGRVDESSLKLRLLLSADRRLVTVGVLLVVFASLVILGTVDPVPLRTAVRTSDPVETLFQALVTAIVTGVTLVVTITQLVLSQELGAVGDQRDRMQDAVRFRADVEEALDAPISPPEPNAFLRAIIDVSRSRVQALVDVVDDTGDVALRDRVAEFADSVTRNADDVSERLDDASFGTFDVVFAALDFNYSWKIYEARRLRAEHAGSLSDEAIDALDGVIEALKFFGPAREHFKTLYFEWELTNLSREMLYAAVPALIVSMAGVLYLDDPGTVTGATLGVDHLVLVVSAATAVGLLPFALLFAYVLRIVTVAKRTLAIGPFVLRETDRSDDIEWD